MTTLNTYANLSPEFFQEIAPTPVRAPDLLFWNESLAGELQFEPALPGSDDEKAAIFSGNVELPGSRPIAMAYAGHQFGGFSPSLGDGRAHLLGEVADRAGRSQEIQLKGSGRTQFSRGGDGRCALGPAVREFIMGEAMFGLGVPTTRSLCVVATGETVVREQPQPGAIVTRVASSHLRVGTFQYFAARGNSDAVQTLVDYATERLFADIEAATGPERALAFFERVVAEQVTTVTDWMRVGFIHGVMNTDNTSISGETIDFGPCAMVNAYHPGTVFSSIDHQGRYAFGNQPAILAWNMARLAECLLLLLGEDRDKAISLIQPKLDAIPDQLDKAWQTMMGRKIGFSDVGPDETALITDLLAIMEWNSLDYTNTFAELTRSLAADNGAPALPEALDPWLVRWRAHLADLSATEDAPDVMSKANPVVIPRNHLVESALAAVVENGDTEPGNRLIAELQDPYTAGPETAAFTSPPPDGDRGYQTFCGT